MDLRGAFHRRYVIVAVCVTAAIGGAFVVTTAVREPAGPGSFVSGPASPDEQAAPEPTPSDTANPTEPDASPTPDRTTDPPTPAPRANGAAFGAAVSTDGRFVAFSSFASNLVQGDTNHVDDTFVRDRSTGAVRRVLGEGGAEPDASVQVRGISGDGRYVLVASGATTLAASSPNRVGPAHLYVHDTRTGSNIPIDLTPSGTWARRGVLSASISRDGRWVIFSTTSSDLVEGDTNGAPDVFLRDLSRGITERISVANDGSEPKRSDGAPTLASDHGDVSDGGRWAVFVSNADNLVADDQTEGYGVYLRDRHAGTTTRVAEVAHEAQITPDGSLVIYRNGSGTFAWSRADGETKKLVGGSTTEAGLAQTSDDGRRIAFVDERYDVSVLDRFTGSVTSLSRGSGIDTLALSGNGGVVVFETEGATRPSDRRKGIVVVCVVASEACTVVSDP